YFSFSITRTMMCGATADACAVLGVAGIVFVVVQDVSAGGAFEVEQAPSKRTTVTMPRRPPTRRCRAVGTPEKYRGCREMGWSDTGARVSQRTEPLNAVQCCTATLSDPRALSSTSS